MGVCLLMWCLGPGITHSERLAFSRELYERPAKWVLGYERGLGVAGFVHQTRATDAVFGGVLPLRIDVLAHRVSLEGGAVLASEAVPACSKHGCGTHANFMATARLRLTRRIAVTYWHWSNGYLARTNP